MSRTPEAVAVQEARDRAASASRLAADPILTQAGAEATGRADDHDRMRFARNDALVSIALSNAVLASVALADRADVDAAAEAADAQRATLERLAVAREARIAAREAERAPDVDPARPATIAELDTAPTGAVVETTSNTIWLRLGDLWRAVGGGTAAADYLVDCGARITHLPVPVAQTPAGPVAAVVSPVPLASADRLPDDVFDGIYRRIYRYSDEVAAPPTWRQTIRHITDAVNVKLRAQFPDETPVEPADETPHADPWRAYDSRDLLAKAALALAAESFGGVDAPARASAASDVDTAARAHVTALGGPVRSPGFLSKPGMISTDNYDPATLAPGSVIVGPGSRVSLCVHENGHDGPSNRWMVVFPSDAGPQWSWRFDGDITDNGVLVVDGATLGGQR